MPDINEIIKFGDGGKSEKLSRLNNRLRDLNKRKHGASPLELKKINDEITVVHSRISKLQNSKPNKLNLL